MLNNLAELRAKSNLNDLLPRAVDAGLNVPVVSESTIHKYKGADVSQSPADEFFNGEFPLDD